MAAGPHPRCLLLDVGHPRRARRVPLVAGEGVRRGGPGARGQRPAHHLPAPAAQRGRARSSSTPPSPSRWRSSLETGLSFLGFGVPAPDTSLGKLVAEGQQAANTRPWLFYFPGLFIILIVLCGQLHRRRAARRASTRADAGSGAVPAAGGGRRRPLEVADLTVDFPTDDGVVHAVRGVKLGRRARDEVLGIVGESGSGKRVTCWRSWACCPRRPGSAGRRCSRAPSSLGDQPTGAAPTSGARRSR